MKLVEILYSLNNKEAVRQDTIFPKLKKVITDFLTPLLVETLNPSRETVSPEFSKVTSVFPVDERKLNKSEISNLQPVTILNTFSKLYGRVLKNKN